MVTQQIVELELGEGFIQAEVELVIAEETVSFSHAFGLETFVELDFAKSAGYVVYADYWSSNDYGQPRQEEDTELTPEQEQKLIELARLQAAHKHAKGLI